MHCCLQLDQEIDEYSSLEVAILSRFPLANAVEFDRGTDGNSRSGYPPARRLERVDLDGDRGRRRRTRITLR